MPKTLINIKEDILRAARKLLFEEGYEKLSIRMIALKCGIATGTLYNYYSSKQEIVGEILKTEWNMMLRRIDQGSKSDMKLIDKLEIIYVELGSLMNDVHNIWLDNTRSGNINSIELSEIKGHKRALLKSLSDKIYSLINDKEGNKDYEFLADVICRIFILYAHEGDVNFKKLSPVITSLLS